MYTYMSESNFDKSFSNTFCISFWLQDFQTIRYVTATISLVVWIFAGSLSCLDHIQGLLFLGKLNIIGPFMKLRKLNGSLQVNLCACIMDWKLVHLDPGA